MSQENVELSLLAVDAWNRRDVEALIALADPDVEWHPALEEIVERKTYRGHAGMRQYFTDLAEEGAESRADSPRFATWAIRCWGWVACGSCLPLASSSTRTSPSCTHGAMGSASKLADWLSHAEGREAAGLSG
jgi:hypothetical protein